MSDEANNDVVNDQADGADQEKGSVKYDTYSRVLDLAKKRERELKEAQERLQKFEQVEADERERKLKDKGKFETLIEEYKGKVGNLEQEKEQYRKQIEYREKVAAFQDRLPRPLKKNQFLAFADLGSMVVDETGNVDPVSADSVVNKFIEEYGEDLLSQSLAKIPPGNAPKETQPTGYMEELRRARSQREFDEIRKKYNKL